MIDKREREAILINSAKTRDCLLVLLRPQLMLARSLSWPIAGFICADKNYRDVGLGEWTGFYDWLRDSESNVLGVRYWLDSETYFLSDRVKDLAYVKIDSSRSLEIYFSEQRNVDASRSCDQDFLYDALFRSDDDSYAIGFGMGGLGRAELASLEKCRSRMTYAQKSE